MVRINTARWWEHELRPQTPSNSHDSVAQVGIHQAQGRQVLGFYNVNVDSVRSRSCSSPYPDRKNPVALPHSSGSVLGISALRVKLLAEMIVIYLSLSLCRSLSLYRHMPRDAIYLRKTTFYAYAFVWHVHPHAKKRLIHVSRDSV